MAEASADYSKHTEQELRDAIATSKEQESRIDREDSDEALAAERAQREQMEAELGRREST